MIKIEFLFFYLLQWRKWSLIHKLKKIKFLDTIHIFSINFFVVLYKIINLIKQRFMHKWFLSVETGQ